MSKKWWAAALVLALALGLSIWYGFHVGLSKSDWSGWAQAGGSIVAILVAVFVANYQFHLSQSSARRGTADTMRAMARLFDEAIDAGEAQYATRAYGDPRADLNAARDHEEGHASQRRFQAARNALHNVRIENLRSADEVALYVEFRSVLDRLDTMVTLYNDPDARAQRIRTWCEEGRRVAQRLRDAATQTEHGAS